MAAGKEESEQTSTTGDDNIADAVDKDNKKVLENKDDTDPNVVAKKEAKVADDGPTSSTNRMDEEPSATKPKPASLEESQSQDNDNGNGKEDSSSSGDPAGKTESTLKEEDTQVDDDGDKSRVTNSDIENQNDAEHGKDAPSATGQDESENLLDISGRKEASQEECKEQDEDREERKVDARQEETGEEVRSTDTMDDKKERSDKETKIGDPSTSSGGANASATASYVTVPSGPYPYQIHWGPPPPPSSTHVPHGEGAAMSLVSSPMRPPSTNPTGKKNENQDSPKKNDKEPMNTAEESSSHPSMPNSSPSTSAVPTQHSHGPPPPSYAYPPPYPPYYYPPAPGSGPPPPVGSYPYPPPYYPPAMPPSYIPPHGNSGGYYPSMGRGPSTTTTTLTSLSPKGTSGPAPGNSSSGPGTSNASAPSELLQHPLYSPTPQSPLPPGPPYHPSSYPYAPPPYHPAYAPPPPYMPSFPDVPKKQHGDAPDKATDTQVPTTSPMLASGRLSPSGNQEYDQDKNHNRDVDNMESDERTSTSTHIRTYLKAAPTTNKEILHRRQRKNSQSRMRAHKHKERIERTMAKPVEERTEEEQKELDLYEQRRSHKNQRSRSRSSEKKETIDQILAKPESQRTKLEMAFLEQSLAAKKRKNEGDRLRRERLKLLGLKKYGIDGSSLNNNSSNKKPRVTARGPLPPELMGLVTENKNPQTNEDSVSPYPAPYSESHCDHHSPHVSPHSYSAYYPPPPYGGYHGGPSSTSVPVPPWAPPSYSYRHPIFPTSPPPTGTHDFSVSSRRPPTGGDLQDQPSTERSTEDDDAMPEVTSDEASPLNRTEREKTTASDFAPTARKDADSADHNHVGQGSAVAETPSHENMHPTDSMAV